MYRFETRKGELAHLTERDCREVFAILTAVKILHPSTPAMLAKAIRACMCDPKNNPEPWFVVHDEDLVALHRRDDDKPVILFVTKELA